MLLHSGTVNQKVAPSPGGLSTLISPRWAWDDVTGHR